MSSMIERVARAVWAEADANWLEAESDEHCLRLARAALLAAKEIADELGEERASVFIQAVLEDE